MRNIGSDVQGGVALQGGQLRQRVARTLGRDDLVGAAVQQVHGGVAWCGHWRPHQAPAEGQHPSAQAVVLHGQGQGQDGALREPTQAGGRRRHAQALLLCQHPGLQPGQDLADTVWPVFGAELRDRIPLPARSLARPLEPLGISQVRCFGREHSGLRELSPQRLRQRRHRVAVAGPAVQ